MLSTDEKLVRLLGKENVAYILEYLEDEPNTAIDILIGDVDPNNKEKLLARLQNSIAWNMLIDKLIAYKKEHSPEAADVVIESLEGCKTETEAQKTERIISKIEEMTTSHENAIAELTQKIENISSLDQSSSSIYEVIEELQEQVLQLTQKIAGIEQQEERIGQVIEQAVSNAVSKIKDDNLNTYDLHTNAISEKIRHFIESASKEIEKEMG